MALKARIKKLGTILEAKQRALSCERSLEQASERVQAATRNTYTWVTGYTETFNEHWVVEGRPTPYEKFPDWPYLVPAEKVEEPDGAACYLLKDGTEIHRIAPPPEVFEYVTGKPIGRAGPRRHSRPAFAPSTAEAEVVSAKKDGEVEILDL